MTSTYTPAERLRQAASKIRDLATGANACLDRAELQWTDLTVSDTAYRATNSPMVWSHYAAAMHPGVGEALAGWLELEADVIAARQAQPEGAEWAVDIGGDHALALADQILGEAS